MSELKSESNSFVVPGSFLSYSEEYVGGENAFEDASGEGSEGGVFASSVGFLERDSAKRQVDVRAFKAKRLLSQNDLVYARIEDLYDTVALTSFKPVDFRSIGSPNDFAYLRISEIKQGFVESFRNHLGIGDIVKARVLEVTRLGIYLTIKEDDLGVVQAFCGSCRRELAFAAGGLSCSACGAKEFRKMPLG